MNESAKERLGSVFQRAKQDAKTIVGSAIVGSGESPAG